MITFGMDGGLTGHPDHAMAGTFATMAFQWARRTDRYPEQLEQGLQPYHARKLYHFASDYLLPDVPPIAPPTVTARVDVGRERFQKKIEAFMQHTTQAPLFDRIKQNIGRGSPFEMYHLLGTREPRQAKFEDDLFDGVVDE
jgi:LmbE family N-acetylglucosaminyl deacetylase